MSDDELDQIYTNLCEHMSELGEAQTPLFLARFALLAILRLNDAAAAQQLIGQARLDIEPGKAA